MTDNCRPCGPQYRRCRHTTLFQFFLEERDTEDCPACELEGPQPPLTAGVGDGDRKYLLFRAAAALILIVFVLSVFGVLF